MKSNLIVLTAQKAQAEKRHLTLRTVAKEAKLNPNMVYAIANDTAKHYPKETLEELCRYFKCSMSDLFSVEFVEEEVV